MKTVKMTTETFSEFKVPLDDLRRSGEPLGVEFETSDQLPAGSRHLGQQRAIDAIRFGLQIASDGHNVFVLGRTAYMSYYIHGFQMADLADPTKPEALREGGFGGVLAVGGGSSTA